MLHFCLTLYLLLINFQVKIILFRGLETYLVEENLSAAEPLTADDFYTIMLEITWKDGREILYVTPDSQALAAPDEHFSPIPDGCTVLDEAAIARINEAAK